jgi:hypothetical protein
MKCLAQKSLKIELWLKSYMVFKFQGLDYKMSGLDCIKNSNLRARSIFDRKLRPSVQCFRI